MQQSDRPAGMNREALDPPPGAPGHKRDDLVTAPTLPVAIIGNGGAAAEAVLAMRASGYTGDIHLFADNDHPPYNPMLGTYLVGGKLPLEGAFPFGDGAAFYESNRVTAHLKNAVAHLDAEGRELTTVTGDTFKYERCLVASGARPSVPPVAGLREALTATGDEMLQLVFTLQTLDDALALKAAVERLLADPSGDPGGDTNAATDSTGAGARRRGGRRPPPPPPSSRRFEPAREPPAAGSTARGTGPRASSLVVQPSSAPAPRSLSPAPCSVISDSQSPGPCSCSLLPGP
jgi:hypothetical protein